VKNFFAKHELYIRRTMALCAPMALLLCWEINLGFLHWWNRKSTLVIYSLLLSSSCFGIKNLASDIQESPWYFWGDHQLDWGSCSKSPPLYVTVNILEVNKLF